MRALLDFTTRSFHFRQSLDICVSVIARLHSYAKAPTKRTDDPIKIRQDLLATSDVVELALHLRRFAEITNSVAQAKCQSIAIMRLSNGRKFTTIDANLYDVVSRVIHSKTCVVCRNLSHVFLHFGAGIPSATLRDGPLGTSPILVVDSDKKEKAFLSLDDFLDVAFKLIDALAQKDEQTREYLYKRKF